MSIRRWSASSPRRKPPHPFWASAATQSHQVVLSLITAASPHAAQTQPSDFYLSAVTLCPVLQDEPCLDICGYWRPLTEELVPLWCRHRGHRGHAGTATPGWHRAHSADPHAWKAAILKVSRAAKSQKGYKTWISLYDQTQKLWEDYGVLQATWTRSRATLLYI